MLRQVGGGEGTFFFSFPIFFIVRFVRRWARTRTEKKEKKRDEEEKEPLSYQKLTLLFEAVYHFERREGGGGGGGRGETRSGVSASGLEKKKGGGQRESPSAKKGKREWNEEKKKKALSLSSSLFTLSHFSMFRSAAPPARAAPMFNAKALAATPHGACVLSMLAVIGAVAALKAWLRLANGIWIYFLRPGKDLKKLGEIEIVALRL